MIPTSIPITHGVISRPTTIWINDEVECSCRMLERITHAVADEFNVPMTAFTAKMRPAWISWPRQVAMALTYENTTLGSDLVAKAFNRRDHGTVLYACQAVLKRIETDAKAKQRVEIIKARLGL